MITTHQPAAPEQKTLATLVEGRYVLHFMVADVQCCLPVDHIKRIITLADLFKTPKAPSYMVGMLNLHGQAIPIIDPCMYLQLGTPKPYSIETTIIICRYNKHLFGIAVGQVMDIDILGSENLQYIESKHSPFIGTVNFNKTISFILDVKYLAQSCETI
ncbi:chemotaxis protein CheW [Endozoicomonas sp. SM1973]|uniref:Chemotaxis protein CheW n=1 Tax=Spartinivicinus marinus TaxID=2994442 RepID=A0A853HW94_9GAMM|nr:chemotaxis protein CheW [Spartinivicinus marinus]MCX4030076.1 chemotaxis protein CheW [Spartinivicinus marinus]NYZ64679.1 chemotaxis protein CheW [Spartinivicinus marinus]